MDMEGRSLGTERPSVSSSSGSGEPLRERFAEVFSSRTSDGARQVRQSRASIEEGVSERIRDGRTDAAQASQGGGDVRDDVRERPMEEAAREADREFDSEPAEEADTGRGDEESQREAPTEQSAEAPSEDSDDASAEDIGSMLTDPAPEDEAYDGAHGGPALQGVVDQWAAGVFRPSTGASPAAPPMVVGGLVNAGLGGPGARPTAPINTIGGAMRVDMAKAGVEKARPAAAPRPPNPAERAAAILDQLRVHIRAGDREATIHLRPLELGLLEMRIRVENGGISASIAAESAETLAVLEAHAPELRAWLSRGGDDQVQLELSLLDTTADDGRGADDTDASGGRRNSESNSSSERTQGSMSTAQTGSLANALTVALSQTNDGIDLVA